MTYDEYCDSTNPPCEICHERASDKVVKHQSLVLLLCGDCEYARCWDCGRMLDEDGECPAWCVQ